MTTTDIFRHIDYKKPNTLHPLGIQCLACQHGHKTELNENPREFTSPTPPTTMEKWYTVAGETKGVMHINHTVYPETTNATDNNKHSWNQQAGSGNNLPRISFINTCLWTTCHRSVWSVASGSQTGIFSLWMPFDFIYIYCSLSRWLSPGNRCVNWGT